MYPDLSYILHDLIGTEPDNWSSIFKTFGMMLVTAILTAAFILNSEMKRKSKIGIFSPERVKIIPQTSATIGEMMSNAIFGLVLGWKIPYIFQNFPEFQNDAAAVLLSGKGYPLLGIVLAIGFAGFTWWKVKSDAEKTQAVESIQDIYPHDRIGEITIVAAVTGIFGAKLFAVIEDIPALLADPIGVFFSGSGLAVYGSFIGGFIGVYWFLNKHNIKFYPFADSIAPALAVSYAVGRVGCHLAGDGDWGVIADAAPTWWFLPEWMWSWDYPNNVNNDNGIEGWRTGLVAACNPECFLQVAAASVEEACKECCGVRYCHVLTEKVYTTPMFEIMASMGIFAFLWAIRKRLEYIPGLLFFIYLIFNGVERYWIEQFRINDTYNVLGFELTQAQQIAVVLILIGIVGSFLRWNSREKVA